MVFLHGFTQTHHHWHRPAEAIRRVLPAPTTTAFVDLPGHGLAGDDRTGIGQAGTRLAALGGRGTWVGYSMGARFALHAALAPDHRIERLVLIGGTAGLDDPAERRGRVAEDGARAAELEAGGLDAFLTRWLAGPLFAHLAPDPDGLEHRRRNTAAGLASSLRAAGTGAQAPLWHRLPEIDLPVLALAGEHDTKFVGLGRRLVAELPRATFATVPAAGHAAHTDQPGVVADLIARWIEADHQLLGS